MTASVRFRFSFSFILELGGRFRSDCVVTGKYDRALHSRPSVWIKVASKDICLRFAYEVNPWIDVHHGRFAEIFAPYWKNVQTIRFGACKARS
jgi:hypothetical protein